MSSLSGDLRVSAATFLWSHFSNSLVIEDALVFPSLLSLYIFCKSAGYLGSTRVVFLDTLSVSFQYLSAFSLSAVKG